MAAKLTRLTHKMVAQLHLVAQNCTIYSSRSRRPVRKLLDTLSYSDQLTEKTKTVNKTVMLGAHIWISNLTWSAKTIRAFQWKEWRRCFQVTLIRLCLFIHDLSRTSNVLQLLQIPSGENSIHIYQRKSRHSSVGTALGHGLNDRGSRVRCPAGAGNFSLHHRVQNGSGTHPAPYPMGTMCFSLGVKRPGREADHSRPSNAEVKEWVELYIHSPNTPSWRGAQLKHRDNFTFIHQHTLLKFSCINILLRRLRH
jgi:hypothetical protein